jgi:hypothetical protein
MARSAVKIFLQEFFMKRKGFIFMALAVLAAGAVFAQSVTGVSLNKTSVSLSVGGSDTLSANVSPSNAAQKGVVWSSSNFAVASVTPNGGINGVSPGSAVITAMTVDGTKTMTCSVTVTAVSSSSGGGTFTSIAAFKTWLDGQPDNSNVSPYYVRVNISNINGNSSAGGSLGNVFRQKINANKYVDLDLSGSTFNSIPNDAFAGCTTLTNVIIPNRVTSIGNASFQNCSCLESVTIPASVTTIGSNAFRNCTSLTSITIPSSVQGIGGSAFADCNSLNSVTFQGTIPSSGFDTYSATFPGDLKNKFFATNKEIGTPGTYTKAGNTWTKK